MLQYDISACASLNPVLSDELITTRRRVADLLLHFVSGKGQQRHYSQSEMAMTLDTSWTLVNHSLISLKEDGAIRIDRPRMTINKNKLKRILISKGYR